MPMTRRERNVFCHAEFNLGHLLRLAEQLRRQPCSCDESQIPKSGALNWAIFLQFDDGVEWVFRAPCSSYAAAQGVTGRLVASEAATLKYIREYTSIPVPEVFHYSSTYENDIGVPYILMSRATGHPLATYDWRTHTHEFSKQGDSATLPRVLTKKEQEKIMRQLGCYARQLFGLRFPTMGSLFEGGEQGYYIDECLSPGHVLQDRETIEDIPRGPFHNEADYYSSLTAALHLHAEQLPMGYHILRAPVPVRQEYSSFAKYYTATDRWNDFATLGGMVDSSVNRLQYCLASQLARNSIIPRMVRPVSQSDPGFPLHHHDISLQNLFVYDDLNITCIIDWAFSSTVPPAQLLATPVLPHPRDLVLYSSLVSVFRSGFETEVGKSGRCIIESDSWKAGEMVSRFMGLVNLDALQDYSHLEVLWGLAWGPETPGYDGDDTDSLLAILSTRATTYDALALAGELAADDEPESEIRRREKEYFDAVGNKRLALAHKVAFAAKMNPRFVADGRLWRWVDAVTEYYDGAESDRPGCHSVENEGAA